MSKSFKIRPGVYTVPSLGRIDATKKLNNQVLIDLYLNNKFPFIELLEPGVKLLKKQKLTNKQIASLINNSKTEEEVKFLLLVNKENEALTRIADLKTKTF